MNRQQQFSIMMFLQYAIWGSWTTALGAYLNRLVLRAVKLLPFTAVCGSVVLLLLL